MWPCGSVSTTLGTPPEPVTEMSDTEVPAETGTEATAAWARADADAAETGCTRSELKSQLSSIGVGVPPHGYVKPDLEHEVLAAGAHALGRDDPVGADAMSYPPTLRPPVSSAENSLPGRSTNALSEDWYSATSRSRSRLPSTSK